VRDIDRYVEIQRSLGARFLTTRPVRLGGYSFIQTPPSRFTGNSLGFIEWDGRRGDYRTPKSGRMRWRPAKPERRYLRSVRRSPNAAVFLAQDGDEIVGRLSVARDPHPASFHVASLGLMVAKTHRRRGIGRALLERAVEWAREAGVAKLELYVFPHNQAAIALYERFGFEREGYRRRHYRRAGELVDAMVMAYELPPTLS